MLGQVELHTPVLMISHQLHKYVEMISQGSWRGREKEIRASKHSLCSKLAVHIVQRFLILVPALLTLLCLIPHYSTWSGSQKHSSSKHLLLLICC